MAVLQTKILESGANARSYNLRLTLTEDSISVTNNTSTISYTLELLSGGYNYGQYGTGYEVIINGVQVAYQARSAGIQTSIAKNSSLTLCTGSTTVTHNTDGTKTIGETGSEITASLDIAGSPGPGAMSISTSSWTLTTIARKSTLSIGNGTLGSARSMTVTTQSTSFTHTLSYTCGSASATMFTKQAASAITTYTFPLSLAAQNTTGTSVSISLTLTTYSGTTSIGSNTYSITMTIPDNSTTKPTIGTITTGEPSGQSHVSTYGGYIQGLSKATVSFSPSGYQGATIKSSSIKIGSMYTYSASSCTSGALGTSGTITITVSATDSRGFTNTGTKTITVLAYSVPQISNVALTRTDSSGNALASGAYGTITFKATGTSLTGNTMTYKVYYKASTASSYSSATMSSYANNFNVTSGKYTFSAATTSSWYAYITVADKFNTTTSTVVTMSSEAAYFKMDPANNAMSIGTIETTANTLRVGWNTIFNNKIQVLGKYNSINYMPYSWESSGNGTGNGYMRIATITITGDNATQPIVFDIIRRFSYIAERVIVCFAQGEDPALRSIYVDQNTSMNAFIVKTGSKTWDLYVYKNTQYDRFSVRVYTGVFGQDNVSVVQNDGYSASVIAGATEASPYVKDYVRATWSETWGSFGTWYCVSWYSGKRECYGTFTYAVPANGWSAWGSVYEAQPTTAMTISYPGSFFSAAPTLFCTVSGSAGAIGYELYGANSKTTGPKVIVLRPNSLGSATTYYVHLHAIGPA